MQQILKHLNPDILIVVPPKKQTKNLPSSSNSCFT